MAAVKAVAHIRRVNDCEVSAVIYTGLMKSKLDIALILGMAICYAAGQFIAADRFALLAMVLLLIFAIRMIGGLISWTLTGR